MLLSIFLFFSIVFSINSYGSKCAESFQVVAFSRKQLVQDYKKTGLPVKVDVFKTKRLEELVQQSPRKYRRFYEAALRDIANLNAKRNMEIVGSYRGSATVVKITIYDESTGISVEEFAKGDIRTEQGRQNVRNNTERAIGLFHNKILDYFETRVHLRNVFYP